MRGEIIFHPSRESMESPLPDATAKVTADSCVNVALEQNPRGSWPTPPRNCRNNRIVRWLFPSSDRPEREAEKEGWREKEGERFKRVCERASVTAHQNCREATAITKACCLRLSVPLSNPSKKKKKNPQLYACAHFFFFSFLFFDILSFDFSPPSRPLFTLYIYLFSGIQLRNETLATLRDAVQ